jgi:hypothetical protein
MLKSIKDYREGIISYKEMVSKLVGAFEASECKDSNISEKWYEFLTPLEIECAMDRMNSNASLVTSCLDDIKIFIERVLDNGDSQLA